METKKLDLSEALKGTYKSKNESAEMMEKSGYLFDSELSNIQSRAYYNPTDDKLLVTYRGTKNLLNDVPTDLAILMGTLQNTERYRSSKQLLDRAKSKYQPNETIIIGDSLGGSLASMVARNTPDQVITFNKGAGLTEPITKSVGNETSYRWAGDIVSGLSIFNSNQNTLGSWKTPLYAHNYENLRTIKPIYL